MADELVQLPDDAANTGPKIDNTSLTVGAETVLRQRVQIGGDDALELAVVRNDTPGGSDYGLVVRTVGSSAVTVATLPLPSGAATETTLAAIAAALAGTLAVTGTVSVASSALPAGAATEATLAGIKTGTDKIPASPATEGTLAGIKTGTDKIPASPAQEHTAANSPSSQRLSDGTNFYDAAKTGQLPSALVAAMLSAVATLAGDAIVVGGVALVPKFASFNLTADGDILAAVSGKKIRVLAMFCSSDLEGTFRIRRTNSGTNWLTGILQVRVGGGFVLPFNPAGWFETQATESLNVDLTTITNLGGALTYIEV